LIFLRTYVEKGYAQAADLNITEFRSHSYSAIGAKHDEDNRDSKVLYREHRTYGDLSCRLGITALAV
jgi:hypothetical protein